MVVTRWLYLFGLSRTLIQNEIHCLLFLLSLREVYHPSPSWSPVALILLDVACLGALACLLPAKVGRVMAIPCKLNMQDFLTQGLPRPLFTDAYHRN